MPDTFIGRLADYDTRRKTEPLSDRLRSAAHGIAAMIDAGELDAAPHDTRVELRALSMEVMAMGDEALDMELQARRPSARELTGPRLAWSRPEAAAGRLAPVAGAGEGDAAC